MRVKNLSLIAVAVAAGLSLTACQSDDTAASASAAPSQQTGPAAQGGNSADGDSATGGTGTEATGTGSGSGANATTTGADDTDDAEAAGSDACTTSQLAMRSAHGMGEGDILVHLENTGSAACDLKGFPGVDLKSKDGSLSADRTDLAAPLVTVAPGEETRFTLHYTPNTSGGSGVTFTSLVVTPPNETHAKTLPVSINLAASDSSAGTVRVDPVGTGK
ncbi:DUF4232 domain-containing protein [Streptomyces ziwulingensis]|uniref:DUF4232 domain-containing protein n=1 Tax=Streptomyces ziwulingensis TaxID=1045501 RepID=A0ABP9CLG7_9ACTN